MYSGSDSNESQKYTQWMNPASYQGMSNEQVDWAALAQQWIIMKEAGPPPIPGEAPVFLNKKSKQKDDEAGEAPMDVENDKEESTVGPVWNEPPPPPPGAEPWTWNNQNQSWNWNNSWIPPTAVPPPPHIGPMKTPLLPTPNNTFNAPPDSGNDNAVPFGNYSTTAGNEINNSHGGYWTSSGTNANANPNATAAAAAAATKHIKPHNKRYSKVNVPVRVTAPLPPANVQVTPAPNSALPLDAAKRKQLPAWIREGLEKMEKDKLKELEKEKQKREREEYFEKSKMKEQETMEILKNTMKERQKSKFESDGENSEDEPKTRQRSPSPEQVPLTPDELMLKVRRTMTEILLNVTNRQIEAICKEELQRYTKKYKGSYQRSAAPSEGANIKAKLGLGMYGEGSDSSSEDEQEDTYKHSFRDSDDDLKDIIRKKVVEFEKTEREIQDRLDEAERRKGGSGSRSTTPESNDNDSQVDARVQDERYQEEKLSPVSSKNYSDSSDYSNTKIKNSRRSSSSDTNESYKKSKNRHKSRSRSRSTDKRHRTSNRWSRSKSPARRESSSSKRDSNSSLRKKSSRRSRSRSYSSRSRRSRSSSYRRSKRSRSRDRYRRTRSRSSSRSRYSSSKSDRKRRRSRSDSSSRGKRTHRH